MDTTYDVVRVDKAWHVCRLRSESAERWELTSGGYPTRAQAFTEMHSQRFADRDAKQYIKVNK